MPVVRGGQDCILLPRGAVADDVSEAQRWPYGRAHTLPQVAWECYCVILREYYTLPPVDTLSLHDVFLFYDALRPTLKARSKRGK